MLLLNSAFDAVLDVLVVMSVFSIVLMWAMTRWAIIAGAFIKFMTL